MKWYFRKWHVGKMSIHSRHVYNFKILEETKEKRKMIINIKRKNHLDEPKFENYYH